MLNKLIPVVMKTTIVVAAAAIGAGFAFATVFSLDVFAMLARLPVPQWTHWAVAAGVLAFIVFAVRTRARLYPPVGRFPIG